VAGNTTRVLETPDVFGDVGERLRGHELMNEFVDQRGFIKDSSAGRTSSERESSPWQ
jgi:hypothetical protein